VGLAELYYLLSAAGGRGLHSSTFRLIISAFCGIRWVVHAIIVTKVAQVELSSGRV
jgi:hypothetical protein